VYPFRWFNAGDFGKILPTLEQTNLVNADVMQVFQSAIYLLDIPPSGSDLFDADLGQACIKVQRINAVQVKDCIERGLPMSDQIDVFRHGFRFSRRVTTANILSR